jgi:small GTP-binding protein
MIVKVVFAGDSGVGKTSLITREYDESFNEKHLATIGVDFRVKNYDLGLVQIKAQLWDTAGQERFRSIQKPYYKSKIYSHFRCPYCLPVLQPQRSAVLRKPASMDR